MLSLIPCIAMLMMFHLTGGTPIAKRTDRLAKLDQLRNDYRGIYWDTAADPNECTDEQFDILAEAVRVAVNDVTPLGANHQQRAQSSAFNRFFIRPQEAGIDNNWINSHDVTHQFINIMSAMDSIIKFPKIGKKDKKGDYVRAKQIKYKCKPWPNIPCVGTTAAKTSEPAVDPDQGWSTVFCPTFFEQFKYINELGNDPPRPPSQLPLLHAYEHAIIHEWMHADVASGRYGFSHITDVEGNLPGQNGPVSIYGATRSHQFAWVNAQNVPQTSVNVEVAINADNFALVFHQRVVCSEMELARRWAESCARCRRERGSRSIQF
jgi:hypothetical protein